MSSLPDIASNRTTLILARNKQAGECLLLLTPQRLTNTYSSCRQTDKQMPSILTPSLGLMDTIPADTAGLTDALTPRDWPLSPNQEDAAVQNADRTKAN